MTELVCDVKIIKIDTLPDNFYYDFNINDIKNNPAPRKAILTFTNNIQYFIYYAALKRNMGVCGKLFNSDNILIGIIRNRNLDNDIIVNNIVSLNRICNVISKTSMDKLLVFTNTVDFNREMINRYITKCSYTFSILFLDNMVRGYIIIRKCRDGSCFIINTGY